MGLRFGQSRSRLVLGVMCLVVAALAVGLVYVPGEWLARAGDALQAAITYLLSFGERSLLFAVGAVLAVLGLVLVILPRRRSHAYWAERPSTIVPISVYVDAENQLHPASLVRPFVMHLRTYLKENRKGQRADLLYFADATELACRPTYEELYRFGFRPIDVPHVPFKDEAVKDAVDMELSLHAFDRGLHGSERQHFIFVTGDRDFLPLVFRLHAVGHTISLWAANPPQAFWAARDFLDNVEVVDLNSVLPSEPLIVTPPATPSRSDMQVLKRQAARRRYKRSGFAFARRTPGSATRPAGQHQHVTIAEGINFTLEVIYWLNASRGSVERRKRLFPIRLGAAHGNFLRRLGYDGNTRIECWVAELVALEVLRADTPDAMFVRGEVDPQLAARRMERFVNEIASAVLELANERRDRVVTYLDVSTRLGQSPMVDAADSGNPLRALVSVGSQRSGAHTRYLCLCARALDLISFEEVLPGTAIRVDFPGEGEQVAADGAPDHRMAGEMVVEKSLVMRDEAGDTGTS